MNIYAVADVHGHQERLDRIVAHTTHLKPDAVVIAGDITGHGDHESLLRQLNDLPAPVLVVRGNMDSQSVEELLEGHANILSLHCREALIKGVHFVGMGGTLPVPFNSKICLREKRLIGVADHLIGRKSVLVAHPPPYGTLDEGFGNLHAGSRGLRRLILDRQPRLFICGHIHERPGWAVLGKTLVVNCSIGRSGAGAWIEMDECREPTVSMLQ
jgi:putative phosphoesterase